MRKHLLVPVLLLVALAAGAFVLFRGGTGGVGADDPLRYVPADTPFVFANVESIPEPVARRWLQQVDPQLAQWRRQIGVLLARAEASPARQPDDVEADGGESEPDAEFLSPRAAAWLRALDAELAQATDAAALQKRFGFDSRAKMAVYGIGLAPVARLTLADPAAFLAAIARIEHGAGEAFTALAVDGVDAGWRIDLPDSPIQGVVAVIGNHLVLTAAPLDDAAATRVMLGLDRPARSLADSGDLQALNRAEGFTAFGSGYLDSSRLLAQFRAPATALERAFLQPLDIEKPALPAECEADTALIAQSFPRLVGGYTRLDDRHMDGVARMLTSAPIAEDLMSLRAPLPGLAASDQALVTFGVGFKLSALAPLGRKLAAAVAAEPWTCPALSGLNDAVATLREGLANPALAMAGPMANSVLLALDEFEVDIEQAKFEKLSGRLVLGADNPAVLIGALAMVAPQVAALNLKPGEPPQRLQLDLLKTVIDAPLHAAMGEHALALAIGDGAEASLPAYLKTDAAEQPLLHVAYQGRFMGVIADAMREAAKAMPAAEAEDIRAQTQLMEDAYVRNIQWLGMSILLTQRGIEFRQRLEFTR